MKKEKTSYGKETDLALNTWVKLARAHTLVGNLCSQNIRTMGLTPPQFGVIEALGHLGPMRVGELCDKMLVSGGNMTLVLDNLERDGLVERTAHKKDRRALLIQLTDKGKNLFNKIFVKHAEAVKDIMSALSENEQKELGKLLKKLGLAITANGSKD